MSEAALCTFPTGLTHLTRSFNWGAATANVIMGLCMVISVLTAVIMLWLIPELFKLAKALETERCEKLLLDNFNATLRAAVDVRFWTHHSLCQESHGQCLQLITC